MDASIIKMCLDTYVLVSSNMNRSEYYISNLKFIAHLYMVHEKKQSNKPITFSSL